jgi:hypothetical protein
MTSPDSIPRYEQPFFDEIDDEEALVCGMCNCFVKCTASSARAVVGEISPYEHATTRTKKALTAAVKRCGVCVRRSELRACGDPICDEGFEERQ